MVVPCPGSFIGRIWLFLFLSTGIYAIWGKPDRPVGEAVFYQDQLLGQRVAMSNQNPATYHFPHIHTL